MLLGRKPKNFTTIDAKLKKNTPVFDTMELSMKKGGEKSV